MNHTTLWLTIVALASAGCAHASKTEAQQETTASSQEDGKDDDDAKKKGAEEKKPPVRAETLTTSRTTKQMFKPDGLKKLQVALASKSAPVEDSGQLDSATQEVLRKYQKDQGLPATGLPDYETLRRLGLKPEEVFHHQPPGARVGVQ